MKNFGGRVKNKSNVWIDEIGEVDKDGNVYDKAPYAGKKGFLTSKFHNNSSRIVIYSLEKQKKLFVIPKDTVIQFNERAIVLPMKYVAAFIKGQYNVYDEDLLGVFNSSGELIATSKEFILKEKFFLISQITPSGKRWGVYSYNGNEVFPIEYLKIQILDTLVLGKPERFYYLKSGVDKKTALLTLDMRIIIPWDFQEIALSTKRNIITVCKNNGIKQFYRLWFGKDRRIMAKMI